MSLHAEGPFTAADRLWLRRTWLKVQDHRCAACGEIPLTTSHARWALDFNRNHDDPPCQRGSECFDCVLGVICRNCVFHMTHLRRWRGYMPRQWVNGVGPSEWNIRALAHLDLGVDLADKYRIESREAG